MLFIRRHDQLNLVNPDIATSGQNAAGFKEVDLLEETFEITTFNIILSAGSFEFSADRNIKEIIESDNYFTILDGDDHHFLILNKSKVESFEFVLSKTKDGKKKGEKEKEKKKKKKKEKEKLNNGN